MKLLTMRITMGMAVLAMACCLTARAETVLLDATIDASILLAAPDSNQGTSDALDVFGNVGDNGKRTLVQFDVNGLPSGRIITSAKLRLYGHPTLSSTNPNGVAMDLYRLTQAWTESEVTWNEAASGTAWTTPGGDLAGNGTDPYATATAAPGAGEAVQWDVTSLVSQWYNDPTNYPNYGLAIGTPMGAEPARAPYLDVQLVGGGNLSLAPLADARILSALPTTPEGTLDRLATLHISSQEQRSVLRFDLSGLTDSSQIESANLVLYRHTVPDGDNSEGAYLDVYRLTTPFVESEVTWQEASSGNAWTAAGAELDHVGTSGFSGLDPYASSTENPAKGDPIQWDITSLVTEWVDGTHANDGLLLRGEETNRLHFFSRESAENIEVHFASSEESSGTLTPQLEVEFAEGEALHAVADTRIGTTFTSPQGEQNHLSVLNDPSQPNEQRSLVKFDLSGLPSGKQVQMATLTLYRHTGPDGDNAEGVDMDVYRMTKDWVEAEAMWDEAASGDAWTTSGADGDFVGVNGVAGTDPYATSNENPAKGAAVTWDLTQLVTEWYEGTADNNGLMLLGGAVNKLHFFSRESGGDELGPRLDIIFAGNGGLDGDLNGDGFVGGDDLDIVRSFWGQNVPEGDLLSGDPSGDGFVGGDDLDIVRANWGQGTPPSPTSVPEPSFLVLMGSVLLLWTVRRFA